MSNIKIGRMVVGPVQTNCYYVLNEDTKEAVIERKDQATGSLRVVATGSWDRGWSACLGCAFVSLLSAVTVCLRSCVPLRDQGQ